MACWEATLRPDLLRGGQACTRCEPNVASHVLFVSVCVPSLAQRVHSRVLGQRIARHARALLISNFRTAFCECSWRGAVADEDLCTAPTHARARACECTHEPRPHARMQACTHAPASSEQVRLDTVRNTRHKVFHPLFERQRRVAERVPANSSATVSAKMKEVAAVRDARQKPIGCE